MRIVDPDRQETQARAFARRRVLQQVGSCHQHPLGFEKLMRENYRSTRVNWPLSCTASSGLLTSAHQVAEAVPSPQILTRQ